MYDLDSGLYRQLNKLDVHWVPLFTSSVRTNTRLQGADFYVQKSFSLITSICIVSGPSVVKGHYCGGNLRYL